MVVQKIDHRKKGGTIPPDVVGDISRQLKERHEFLKARYPDRDYSHRTLGWLMGTSKSWITHLLGGRYNDVRVSSLFRLATVLGCDIKFVLVPKENKETD